MNNRRKTAQAKLLMAVGIFAIVVIMLVTLTAGNCVNGRLPWVAGNTISWFVGSETWSAIIFAVTNIIVMWLLTNALWEMGEEWGMKKIYFMLVTIIGIAFVWLSVFPIGFFDAGLEKGKSAISLAHELGSRTMFLAMILVGILMAMSERIKKVGRMVAGGFVIYGLIFAVGYLLKMGLIMNAMLIFESTFIGGFMLTCLVVGLDSKKARKS